MLTWDYWLRKEIFYSDSDVNFLLMVYGNCFPVPADCTLFLKAVGKKIKPANYVAYTGNLDWCNKCMLFNRHCNGKEIKINTDLF